MEIKHNSPSEITYNVPEIIRNYLKGPKKGPELPVNSGPKKKKKKAQALK